MSVHVGWLLRQNASRRGASVALTTMRGNTSYAELDERACRLAARLSRHDVLPGDRVLLCAGNDSAYVAAYFAILYAGATVVPVPVVSAPAEVAFRARHAKTRVAFVDAARRDLMPEGVLALDPHDEDDGATLDPRDAPATDVGGGLAMILYTSGTTGTPKGAMITHASLVAHTGALVHHVLRLEEDDVVMGALPLTHSFGIRMTVLTPFYAGARTVLVDRFDAPLTLALAEREAVSWLPGVPTMFDAWGHTKGMPLAWLRWCLSAGAPLPAETRRRAEKRLGAEVREGYGLTEATFTTIDAPPDLRTEGSVGRPVWGVEVTLRKERDEDEVGEVLVRGQNVMVGYLDDPAATREAFEDGWLRTGDLGRLEDGRLVLVDRLKDLVLRGGHNVYPSEVEHVLVEHPAVREAAVVGRPDSHLGEEVVAVLTLHDGATLDLEELDAFCRARLSKVKLPREIAIVDAMPLGPSRKILRRTLRAQVVGGELETRPVPRGT
ncbi:MAG: AMP-binding protein [Sandaracinus sp.]|nr:AMP-binding protein [Sandaracinus sp.]